LTKTKKVEANQTHTSILDAAVVVFGKYGYKKSSMDDIAKAAEISKQGLYLHFSSKEELFIAAMEKYLDDGLALAEEHLDKTNKSLSVRIYSAIDAWFGRHMETFSPQSFDVLEAGNRLSAKARDKYKLSFKKKLAKAITESIEFGRSGNLCTPEEIAETL